MPEMGREENNFPETNIINHPIERYSEIDQNLVPDGLENSFKNVPAIANPQIIPNMTQAKAERIETSKNGV